MISPSGVFPPPKHLESTTTFPWEAPPPCSLLLFFPSNPPHRCLRVYCCLTHCLVFLYSTCKWGHPIVSNFWGHFDPGSQWDVHFSGIVCFVFLRTQAHIQSCPVEPFSQGWVFPSIFPFQWWCLPSGILPLFWVLFPSLPHDNLRFHLLCPLGF